MVFHPSSLLPRTARRGPAVPAALFVVMVLGVTVLPAAGQSWRSGLQVGVTSSALSGDVESDFTALTRLGASVAVGFDFHNGLLVGPEIGYAVKGGTTETRLVLDDASRVPVRATFEVAYLELPLLAAYRLETRGRLHPLLYAGPYLALRLQATVRYRALDGGPEFTDEDPSVQQREWGLVAGGGVEIDAGGERLLLTARYGRSLSNVRDVEPALHHNTVTVLLGFVF